jgi:RHS repeat-associated protein
MKSSLISRFGLLLAVSFPVSLATADTTPVDSFPAAVVTTLHGAANKEITVSEPPRDVLSDLPARPSRSQLQALRLDGLVLTAVPNTGDKSGREEEKLAAALKAFSARKNPHDASALETFLSENPASPWTPALRVTCGSRMYYQGRFSEALECFEKAWHALKDSEDPAVRAASVSAAAELAGLYARLGRMEELRNVLKEVEGRPISGPDTEKFRMAAEGLESMAVNPEHSFKCGPYALRNIRESLGLQPAMHPCIDGKKSTVKGVSLAELQSLAGEMDMDWVAAERNPGAALPLPLLVHWKVGHYAAVLKRMDDGRLLVCDPTFLHDFLITPEVFDRESSGRFLVPRKVLGRDWRFLSKVDAAGIFGKGAPTSKDPDDAPTICKKCPGMAVYDFDLFKAGLIIRDTPLWYDPPYGPAIEFNLTYRQRSEHELGSAAYGFGPKWTLNWSSYLQQSGSGHMVAFLPGGVRETYFLNYATGEFERQKRSLSKLVKTSVNPIIYELQQTDGSKMVFSRNLTTSGDAKLLLTSQSDAQGNTLTLTYNSSNRLIGVTDSLGQTSNLYYENPAFAHLVTKISDPFIPSGGVRRSASFAYDSIGRLIKITDPEGIESSFTYGSAQPDFITSLTTPYGTTTFTTNLVLPSIFREVTDPFDYSNILEYPQYVEVTDPLNRKERIEYRSRFSDVVGWPQANWLPRYDPTEELPDSTLINRLNDFLYYGNTLHWDKKTFAHYPPNPATGANYDKAVRHKWMWHQTAAYRAIGMISSIKKPFESRIWYEYPGQDTTNNGYGTRMGNSEQPSKIGRRISPTETQVDQFETNSLGRMTKHTDTLGRIRKWEYDAATGMDLLNVKQQNGGTDETLATFTYDPSDPPRLPRTLKDASGQTTTLSWNARGQITGATQPGSLVTTWSYNPTGYLTSVDGPLAGTADSISYTYDLYGRIRTETSPGAHVLTYDYDKLDRPTLVTYPDSTTEQFSYQRPGGSKILDLTDYKDRENRWTKFGYNALRERISTIDPLNRPTVFNWCYCGALQDLWDGEGNKTHWDYDIGGRLLKKTYADGKEENHTYDLAGRLSTTTDAKAQIKTHSYYKDGQLAGIAYTNSQHPTANVGFTYDPVYGRLSQMTDGTGTTGYAYHPVNGSTFGAGNLHIIDGPLANDTIAHTYDVLGRPKTRTINGSANTTTVNTYDALGRVESLTNPLGTFLHTYDPVNLLPKTVTAPNGLTTTFDYHTVAADLRLKEIKHQLSGNVPLSTHGYTYSPSGNIKSWSQTTGTSPAKTWGIAHDRADQLEAATLTDSATAVLEQHAWRYDKIGNRASRQNGQQITQSTHNNRNQITSESPGGWMRLRGTTNEPATVRVKSNANPFTPAATTAGNEFSGWVTATPGSNSVTIEAKDTSPNANTRTSSYTISVTGTSRIPTYDLNGNTTANGTGQVYDWDAEDRLIKITYADNSSTEFSYDGFSRRVRITEKNASNSVITDKRYLWAGGNQPAEERDSIGTSVLKQYHQQGEFIPAASSPLNKLFYTRDHLGSLRELVDDSGALKTRYDYDMWGKRTKLSGTANSDVGYTGHHHHAASGLTLTWFRAYDAESGRWLSADPIGEEGGLNLYGYVGGNPMNRWDPLGLCWKDDFRRSSTWAGSAFGMGLGFLMGGGGGAVASVPTAGIAAIGTVPAGAIAGAAVGTAAGAVVGAAAAEAGIALADFASRWSDDSDDDGGGFCKMPQGDNTAKNKQFTDALKDLKIPKGSPLARKLHDAITGRGVGGYKDILKFGRENGFQQ